MSGINNSDQELLDRVKGEVGRKAGLGNMESWTQKDYDFLVFYVEENSGVKISLTTLKRIWKNEYNRLPHSSTLDALSQIAFHKDWLSLKLETTRTSQPDNEIIPNIRKEKKVPVFGILLTVTGSVLALLIIFSDRLFPEKINPADVRFSARTSVNNKIPNSVIFDYDISKLKGDKFYLQQSWDPKRRVEISKNNHQQTDIYYLPGYHMAKILAGELIIKEYPVHITTDDWVVAAHQGKIEDKIIAGRKLTVSRSDLESLNVDMGEPYQLTFHNSRNFNVNEKDFSFSTSFKIDSSSVACPNLGMAIKGMNDYFFINFEKKGCESEVNIRVADKKLNGKKTDLTAFGLDVYRTQKISVTSKNQVFSIFVNDKKIFETTYTKPPGSIKELVFLTNSTLQIDYANLN